MNTDGLTFPYGETPEDVVRERLAEVEEISATISGGRIDCFSTQGVDATASGLAHCLSCWTATDSPLFIPDDWRYFDNGGRTFDRYSIWQGDGYLGCSDDPFHPQGFGQHCDGMHPDDFGDELEERIGVEVQFSDLPRDVRRAVLQDARLICEYDDAA